MKTLKTRVAAARRRARSNLSLAFRNENGAFDLPSILVGVLVVAVMALGVMAVVFGIIPFAQDKSAEQNLAAINTAQGTYFSQSTSYPGNTTNTYATLAKLAAAPADLLGDDLALANPETATAANKVIVKAGKFHWYAVTRSDSGKFMAVSDTNPVPRVVA
ncbi:MAG TPA: hypothetical protein VF885_17125, partial [Arthrobacter sp.]